MGLVGKGLKGKDKNRTSVIIDGGRYNKDGEEFNVSLVTDVESKGKKSKVVGHRLLKVTPTKDPSVFETETIGTYTAKELAEVQAEIIKEQNERV